MEDQLELVAKSYDRHFVEYGKKDAPSYDNLPDCITNDPDYSLYKTELETGSGGSECISIKEYLSPSTNMNFIDLGCCLNLMLKGYDEWPSTYYGVDISKETIQVLNEFVDKKSLVIGDLYHGSIHETLYEDNYFDIGACIGVLEYFEKGFVEKAIMEVHRILKPNGKLVLDIPNIKSPTGRIMMLIEEYLGRPEKFNLLPQEFESMLQNYFDIEKTNRVDNESEYMGFRYYLRCKK